MALRRRTFLQMAASAAAVSATSRFATAASDFPSRPITLVVGFAAGGPTDVYARVLAQAMQKSLGVPVIVEAVPGAAGSIGAGRVARAAPDGYTLSVGPGMSTHVINGAIYDLPYDVVKDFTPISLISFLPQVILAKKEMPADNLKGLVAWLKANPDVAMEATSGSGSPAHVAGIFLQKQTATQFRFIPYRGLGPALQDLVAGRVDFTIDAGINGMPFVRSGAIKAYAVMSENRSAAAPDIPTVDEAGVPGLHTSLWQSIFAPRGMPEDVVQKLNRAVTTALTDWELRARFAEQGHIIVPLDRQGPEALAEWQRSEIEKWWPIIKVAKVKGE
jgi:tripartite-type tricarboxylate transporter receptor subunit TctC